MILLKKILSVVVFVYCFVFGYGLCKPVFAKEIKLDEINTQAYNYDISVTVPKPNYFLLFPLNKLARTKISVTFPLDWAGTEIYIDTVEPKVDAFEFGSEWAQNQYLTFLLPADSKQTIHITGNINISAVNIDQLTSVRDVFQTLTMDKMKKFNLHVNPTQLIESDKPKIIETAKKIRGDKNKFEDVVMATYDFVVNRIDYDTLSVDLRNNGTFVKPQSAVETLEKGSGVCVDYSRLLIALLRAQGIPSRMVIGAVNLPRQEGQQMPLHAWVQIFIPNSAFIDIDPTWGESGKKYISDIDTDHIRLQFSTPGDIENFESINVYQSFKLDNYLPFMNQFNEFDSTINFTPIDKIEGLEDTTDIRALAPVFISKDKGFLNSFPNTVRYVIYNFITNPVNLFLFQTIILFLVCIKIVFIFLKRRSKKRKKSQRSSKKR